MICSVVRAVILAALFAKFAEFTEFKPQRFDTTVALLTDPSFGQTAFTAMLAVVVALTDSLVTFLAFRAMLIAVFTIVALFAVIDPGAIRAGPAIIAHEFTAVDAVLALVGTLPHVGVAVAAFRAMISAACGALLADSAGFAKFYDHAERALTAFRAEEFLVAIDAMLAAVGARIGLLVEIFVIDHVDVAVCTHLVGAVLLKVFQTILTERSV